MKTFLFVSVLAMGFVFGLGNQEAKAQMEPEVANSVRMLCLQNDDCYYGADYLWNRAERAVTQRGGQRVSEVGHWPIAEQEALHAGALDDCFNRRTDVDRTFRCIAGISIMENYFGMQVADRR